MSINEIEAKIAQLQEWENLLEEAKKEADALRDSIKEEMLNRGRYELTCGRFIVRLTPIISSRFDTAAFKREHGEMYRMYSRQVESRRFSVSA